MKIANWLCLKNVVENTYDKNLRFEILGGYENSGDFHIKMVTNTMNFQNT